MTNSQGRWAASREDDVSLRVLVPEGKEKNWPIKISTTGFTMYNNVAEAQGVVDKRAALDEASCK